METITVNARRVGDDREDRYQGPSSAGATSALIPLVYFVMPESVHWLARKQPSGALERINATLSKMGHAAVAALSAVLKPSSIAVVAVGTARGRAKPWVRGFLGLGGCSGAGVGFRPGMPRGPPFS